MRPDAKSGITDLSVIPLCNSVNFRPLIRTG